MKRHSSLYTKGNHIFHFCYCFLPCADSVSLLKIQDVVLSCERLIELKKGHCELLKGKVKNMEHKVSGLQKELSETKEMASQLEHQKVEWEQELSSLRYNSLVLKKFLNYLLLYHGYVEVS